MKTNSVIFEVSKSETGKKVDLADLGDDSRFIRYNFSSSFFKLKQIGATLVYI